MTNNTLSLDGVKRKIKKIESQISEQKEALTRLEELLEALSIIRDNYSALTADDPTASQAQSLFDDVKERLSEFPTKKLIFRILEMEKKPMTGDEIFNVFNTFRPNISKGTVKTAISELVNKQHKLIKQNEGLRFEYSLKEQV